MVTDTVPTMRVIIIIYRQAYITWQFLQKYLRIYDYLYRFHRKLLEVDLQIKGALILVRFWQNNFKDVRRSLQDFLKDPGQFIEDQYPTVANFFERSLEASFHPLGPSWLFKVLSYKTSSLRDSWGHNFKHPWKTLIESSRISKNFANGHLLLMETFEWAWRPLLWSSVGQLSLHLSVNSHLWGLRY